MTELMMVRYQRIREAAPEMYEALSEVRRLLNDYAFMPLHMVNLGEIYLLVSNALIKAETDQQEGN